MNTLSILEFKATLATYINEQDMPCEVKRMVVSEILKDLETQSSQEAMMQIQERDGGKDNG